MNFFRADCRLVDEYCHAVIMCFPQRPGIERIDSVGRPEADGIASLDKEEDSRPAASLDEIAQFEQVLGAAGSHGVREHRPALVDPGAAFDFDKRGC